MSISQPTPGTPKEKLRALRILSAALITGVVLFSFVMSGLNSIGEFNESAQKFAGYESIILAISAAVAVVCFLLATSFYKKEIATVRGTLISMSERLDIMRSALIKYLALCEGAALLSLILFFLTGYFYLLIVTGVMLIAMLAKWPGKERVINDLEPDQRQQMELD